MKHIIQPIIRLIRIILTIIWAFGFIVFMPTIIIIWVFSEKYLWNWYIELLYTIWDHY